MSVASQRRHCEMCQVASATACISMPQPCREKAGLVIASQRRHSEMCQVACATVCNSMPRPSCEWCGHDRCHATTGTRKCAPLDVQPHAASCCSQAVIGVVMTDVIPPRAITSVPGCVCNRMSQPGCDWCGHDQCHATTGTQVCQGCMRNRMQQHATAKL